MSSSLSGFLSVLLTCIFISLSTYYIYTITPYNNKDRREIVECNARIVQLLTIGECNVYLLYYRVISCLFIVCINIYLLIDQVGITLVLHDKQIIKLCGISRYTTFTVQSFTLIGVYFIGSAYCSYVSLYSNAILDKSILHSSKILYETVLPIALLVFVVVRFVLEPAAKRNNAYVKPVWTAYIMHNVNILLLLIDLIFNNIRFNYYDIVYPISFGLYYCIFAWIYHYYTGIFYYFFLDYKRKNAVYAYIGLVAVLSVFFVIALNVSNLIK